MESHIGWLAPPPPPPGQLSFILLAASDTLPTPLNLRHWRLHVDSKYSLCGSASPTVLHILNTCPTSLNQGRFTWRHDSVLQRLVRGIIPALSKDEGLYADLPNHYRLGLKASLITLEVGALGHSLPQTHSDLKHVLPCFTKRQMRHLFDDAGKISITCSHAIF